MLISTFFFNHSITEISELKSFRSTIQFSYLLSLFDKTYFTFCLTHSKTTQITLITRIIICSNNNNNYIVMYNIYLYFISAALCVHIFHSLSSVFTYFIHPVYASFYSILLCWYIVLSYI